MSKKIDYWCWGMSELVAELESRDRENEGAFKITSVAREDLESRGFDTSKVSDSTMKRLASKMADAYCEQGFWIDLEIIAEYLGVPKQK